MRKANVRKAKLIVEKAKAEIIEHIRYEVSLIHHAVVREDEGEDGYEYVTEDEFKSIKTYAGIDIDVQDPYTDEYYSEGRLVTEVHNEDDGTITIYTDNDEEISSKELNIVNLTDIAEVLEKVYENIVKSE